MTIKLITAFVLAFLIATAFGKYYIPWLHKQKAGQEIKGQVTWHMNKSGTPTMGGVMFIGLAINLTGISQKKIKVGDMLPAIFVPILYMPIAAWITGLF